MFYQNAKRLGRRVHRYDNETQQGVIVAVSGMASLKDRNDTSAATFRVKWDCGWKEDCDDDEIVLTA